MKSKDEYKSVTRKFLFLFLTFTEIKKKLVVHVSGMRYISGILKRQIPVIMLITAYSTAEF